MKPILFALTLVSIDLNAWKALLEFNVIYSHWLCPTFCAHLRYFNTAYDAL